MLLSPRYEGPPILTIAGTPRDQLAPVTRQRRRMERLLATIDEDGWSTPSRCAGWTVQDVVAHLVGVNAFWQASVEAGLAGEPTRILAAFDPAATPPLMVNPMRALSPTDVHEQFVASNDGFLDTIAALDDDGWQTLAESPAGHVPIRLLAAHALWDAWIHERDIALPLGAPVAVEADEVRSSLIYAAAIGPALALGVDGAFGGQFAVAASDPDVEFVLEVGDSVVVNDAGGAGAPCLRGNAVELVEALSIRAALPASAPLEWQALVLGLATAFDSSEFA